LYLPRRIWAKEIGISVEVYTTFLHEKNTKIFNMIIVVNDKINDIWVNHIVDFKYYMEEICKYKVVKDDAKLSIFQTGYFFNDDLGWRHIGELGNSKDILNRVRELKLDKILDSI